MPISSLACQTKLTKAGATQNPFSFFLRISPQRGAHFFDQAIFLKTVAAQLRDFGALASQRRAMPRHGRTTDSEGGLATSPPSVVYVSMQNIDVFECGVNFSL